MVGYAFWPFGRKPVSRSAINDYMERNPEEYSDEQLQRLEGPQLSLTVRRVLGVLWALTLGWILAFECLLAGILNLWLRIFLITIPVSSERHRLVQVGRILVHSLHHESSSYFLGGGNAA